MASVVEHRRALHRIPELDDRLPETLAYVEAVLAGLPCRVFSPIPGGLCAYFDAGRAETAAFRADLDALPVEERSCVPFASQHPGIMHACGHDGHAAMLLALAQSLPSRLGRLPRNVLCVFQPSEETTGGAKRLCETGLFQTLHVARVFGLHLWPELPKGGIFSRPGPLMARSSEVTVALTGKSVHLSKHEQGIDALSAGCEFLRRAYAMMDDLPPEPPSLLRFGKMTSGTVRNAVSGNTSLEGSLRTYSEEAFARCRTELEAIGQRLSEESGCAVRVHLSEGYPAVWNDEGLYAEVCARLGGAAPGPLPRPVLAAEDFSFYQREAPGLFFFLGLGDVPPLHAPEFCFDDEAVLPRGLAFLQTLVEME